MTKGFNFCGVWDCWEKKHGDLELCVKHNNELPNLS